MVVKSEHQIICKDVPYRKGDQVTLVCKGQQPRGAAQCRFNDESCYVTDFAARVSVNT